MVLLLRKTTLLLYSGRVVETRRAVRVAGFPSVNRTEVAGSTYSLYEASYQVKVEVIV